MGGGPVQRQTVTMTSDIRSEAGMKTPYRRMRLNILRYFRIFAFRVFHYGRYGANVSLRPDL